ncbi:MAG: class I SAM-dependent methyltransferase [Planctomycetota bacterium]|nr:class I SAM-dependent methyltransferase [Planctomycetota bacterium]
MTAGHDDTSVTLDAWHQLHSPRTRDLLLAVEAIETPGPSELGRLRREWPAPVVSAALELSRARRKARAKFEHASELWCDVPGVEQASSEQVAGWKAGRFREAGAESVLDLCCGIGGDTRSLAAVAAVHAIDLDPIRCWMAGLNAGCTTEVADAAEVGVVDRYLHVDPARRDERSGRRRWNPEDHRPPWSVLGGMLARARGAACKLGPGLPLPLDGAPDGTEYEVIQERGQLVQGVLWCGALAREPGRRRATLLPEAATVCGNPGRIVAPARPPVPGEYLVEAAPALERTELVAHLLGDRDDVGELAPGLGLLGSPSPLDAPWFTSWLVEEVLPMRERPLRRWLRDHDTGEVVVRTRGGAVPVDEWAKSLRGEGSTRRVLFALRLGDSLRAVVVQSTD